MSKFVSTKIVFFMYFLPSSSWRFQKKTLKNTKALVTNDAHWQRQE